MTKEEWAEVQKALENFYHYVELDVDGYRVDLMLERVSTYRNAISIYVNGVFKGEWLLGKCEECRRFLPQKQRKLYSPQKVEELRKAMRVTKKAVEKYNPTMTYHSTHWTSFGALKKHLVTNNENICLVKIT